MKSDILSLLTNNNERLLVVENVLKVNNIDYHLLYDDYAKNIIVELNADNSQAEKGIVVLGAHYDIFPNSLGINDNTCALAVLINFIKLAKLYGVKRDIEVVFFDKEESGMLGSNLYVSAHKKHKFNHKQMHGNVCTTQLANDRPVDYALIFDIVGYGDTLVYGTKDTNIDNVLKETIVKKTLSILPSDNMMFEAQQIPVALITAVHDADLIKKSDSCLIKSNAKFYESFHNRSKDNDISIINFELLDSLHGALSSTFLNI